MSVGDLRADTFTLSSPLPPFLVTSPGICEFVGANDGRKWDEQAGFGLSGASLVGGGGKLSHFAARLKIWDVPPLGAQWVDYELFKLILPKRIPGVRSPALGIFHPILADVGISSVVFEDRTQWSQDDQGLWSMQIKFIQYAPAMLAFAKAAAGVPAGVKGPPTAGDAHDAAVAAAQRQLELAAGR